MLGEDAAGLGAAPGTGWHLPGTAWVSSRRHNREPWISCTARGGTWRPLQQKLKMSSGTIIFPLTIFKRHLERRRVALVTAGLAERGWLLLEGTRQCVWWVVTPCPHVLC